MKKITKKELFEVIAAETSREDVKEFCAKEIATLESRAAKAKERAAKKRAEGDALKDAVKAVLTSEFKCIADIAASIEGEDVTVSKVVYRLTSLVKEGIAVKKDITVETADGKTKKVKGYALA